MPDDIRIEQLTLSKPRLIPFPFAEKRGEEWIEVAIGVKNYSASRTYYLMSSVRALKYDSETRSLVVSCSEPIRDLPMPHITLPDVVPLLPEAATAIRVDVPVRIKALTVGKRPSAGLDIIEVSDVERVTCRVQYSDVPFHPTGRSSDDVTKELAEWGERAEKTFRAKVGEEGREQDD